MPPDFQEFRNLCRGQLMLVEQMITDVSFSLLESSQNYCVIDGGAHHGYHALRFAALEGCRRVLAVEADPFTVQTLRRRVETAAEAIKDKIDVLEVALQEDMNLQSVDWMSSESHPGRSGISSIWQDDSNVQFRDKITVKTTTIDKLMEATPEPCAFIKLDLEGGDFMALKGAQKTMKTQNPCVVFENSNRAPGIYSYTIEDVLAYLASTGYSGVTFSGEPTTVANFFDFWEMWACPQAEAEKLSKALDTCWRRLLAESR